ncbi:MAG: TetR/AcrR family transcriptional regulator [Bacillus sp. (in: Bacteria)]|nr:TetR/AcrR family transcriptional regulator [Bacillus sp. (in: firmicutes)]
MPKQTFFNLPEDKRQRITNVAIDEFAQYHFNDVSINRIIEIANISRGSFYQYFDDLEDLYRYIFQLTGEIKQTYMNQFLSTTAEVDFFTKIRGLYQAGLQFAIDHPKFARIGNHLFKGDKAFKTKVLGEWEEYTKQYFIQLLKEGQENGTVRKDIDLQVTAFLLYQMSISLTDHYLMDSDWFENIQRHVKAADEILKIMEHGIKPNKS